MNYTFLVMLIMLVGFAAPFLIWGARNETKRRSEPSKGGE